jgi:hypothetical protein
MAGSRIFRPFLLSANAKASLGSGRRLAAELIQFGFETARRSFKIDWVDDSHIVIAPRNYLGGEHWLAV